MARVLLTTLHVFRVRRRTVPLALARVAADGRALRRTPGLRFWKLLGTGDGRTFDLRDADPSSWALLAVWSDAAALADFERRSKVAASWRRLAHERWRADLRVIAAHGRWSGQAPFGAAGAPVRTGQPVAALTRARLRLRHASAFWRAVPPVTAEFRAHPGVLFSVGLGEAPVGFQGTFSVWRSEAALRDFAYRRVAHRRAIAETRRIGWYAEELFARFAVLGSTGTVRGADPLTRPFGSFSPDSLAEPSDG